MLCSVWLFWLWNSWWFKMCLPNLGQKKVHLKIVHCKSWHNKKKTFNNVQREKNMNWKKIMHITADQLQMVLDTCVWLFCVCVGVLVCFSVFASQIQLFIISSSNTVWLFLVSVPTPSAQVSNFVYYLLCCTSQCLGRTQCSWQSCHCVGVIIMSLHREQYSPCVAEHCAPHPNW